MVCRGNHTAGGNAAAGNGAAVVGVGLIGSGFIASTYAEALQDVRNAEITANYSRDLDRARAFAGRWGPIPSQYDDIAALCADPAVDLVAISLPNEVHLEATRIAAAAGKGGGGAKALGRRGPGGA